MIVRNLLAAVALLALGGVAGAEEPPVRSTPNAFGGYNYSSGGYSQPNVFGGSTFYLKGKTYEVVLKGRFDGQVVDKAWAVKQTVSMAYQAEMKVERTIEENDGEQIVELRKFVTSRSVKLLAAVESVKIDLGPRGMLVLDAVAFVQPGVTQASLDRTMVLTCERAH
jgi:opacity protein-like surface antigen